MGLQHSKVNCVILKNDRNKAIFPVVFYVVCLCGRRAKWAEREMDAKVENEVLLQLEVAMKPRQNTCSDAILAI